MSIRQRIYKHRSAEHCLGSGRYAIRCGNWTKNLNGFCHIHWKDGTVEHEATMRELREQPRHD